MSKLYTTATSDAVRTLRTARGHNHVSATVQSWEGSVGLTMWLTSTGEVRVSLSVETGSTNNPHRELWDRPLSELLAEASK